MNKKLLIGILAALSLIVAVPLFLKFGTSKFTFRHSTHAHPLDKPTFRIAILEPAIHPAIDQIADGFVNEIQKSPNARYEFATFNAQGDMSLLHSLAQEASGDDFDLIMPIGAQATQMIKQVTDKKRYPHPVVFAAIDDPVHIGLVDSLASSGNHVTGVTEQPQFAQQIEHLLNIAPQIKTILLAYNPTHGTGLEKHKTALQELLQKKGITLLPVEIYNSNEIAQKLPGVLPQTDVVMILKDNTLVSGIDNVVKLAQQYQKPLYASDQQSAHRGAALAYGIEESDSGRHAAHKAREILEGKKPPREIPITPATGHKMVINHRAAHKQGLAINEASLPHDVHILEHENH